MMKNRERVLIFEGEKQYFKHILSELDYEFIEVSNSEDLTLTAENFNPSLIIGDLGELGRPVDDICKELKNNYMIRHIPVVIISDKNNEDEIVRATNAGVSDYITVPCSSREAVARIKRSIRETKRAYDANPLTHLPGNISIQEKLEKIVMMKKNDAVAYFDIDHFKSYNDMYGYAKGDQVIYETARLINETRNGFESFKDQCFIGHVGGDDFIMIAPEAMIEDYCKHYIEKFDQMAKRFYDSETSKRGYMIGRDRKGKVAAIPLFSISIAVVVNEEGEKFKHVGEIASQGAEVKKYLKSLPGSSYLIDRRK